MSKAQTGSELARRCRPTTLADMWGNEAVVKSLTALLDNPKRPQTYLFKGPGGTGKTTAARAFAHDLGIDELDIKEMNASDNNGVDDMRALMDELQYRGWGNGRAVILDECHRLSAAAQSSILKLTEEPPEGCYLLLCTTDPQQLSKPLLTRCLQMELRPITEDEMIKRLKGICRSEDMDVSIDVIESIADKSEGVPRVALKLLDKVDGLDEDDALRVLAKEKTGSDDMEPDIRKLCSLLLKGALWGEVADILKNVKGSDVEGVRRQIAGYMAAVLLKSGQPKAACILGYFTDSFFASGYAGLVYATYGALAESSHV